MEEEISELWECGMFRCVREKQVGIQKLDFNMLFAEVTEGKSKLEYKNWILTCFSQKPSGEKASWNTKIGF